MFNRIILIGNLTRDPEVRYTPGGTPVTTLRLAVSSKFKQGDDTKEETLFIDTVVFGKQAESCGKFLNKGNPVLVEGRLRERKWETEGVQKNKFEVIARDVRFMPKRDSARGGQATAEGSNIADMAPPDETTDLEPF